jgi:hypothetical protein
MVDPFRVVAVSVFPFAAVLNVISFVRIEFAAKDVIERVFPDIVEN